MTATIGIYTALVFCFFAGFHAGRLSSKTKEDGYYIVDDRNPDKTVVTLDLHTDPRDVTKKRFVTFRVFEKK